MFDEKDVSSMFGKLYIRLHWCSTQSSPTENNTEECRVSEIMQGYSNDTVRMGKIKDITWGEVNSRSWRRW